MKKLLSAALALALCLSLAACGGNAAADTADAGDTGAAADAAVDEGTDAAADADAEADAAESDYEKIVAKGKMFIGYTEYAPMNYHDDEGNFVGFDTELATSVCELLGVEPDFVEINWDTKFVELESGSIDAVWNGMTLTDDIKATQACSEPYAHNAQVVVMKAGNDYTDTTSLIGKAVAVEQGSVADDLLAEDEVLSQADRVGERQQTDCLPEVAAGTSYAAILDLTLADAMIGPDTDYADLVIVDTLNDEEYGVAFRKGSDLAEQVNNAFKGLVATGRMQEISDRYGVALTDNMMAD